MDSARSQLVAAVDRLAQRAGRRLARSRRDAADTDLAITAILARGDGAGLSDTAGFVGFLRDCFCGLRFPVEEVRALDGEAGLPGLRFDTMLGQLPVSVPPIPEQDAVRIGRIADDLLSRTDPFERPDWATDVGMHARIASSFGRKGRLLAAVVRAMRVERAMEIGTAYGMSSLFLAAAMGERGRLVTAERSEPQVGIATEVLAREHPDTVTVFDGISTDLEASARERLGEADLLFHDGEHSLRAYVDDFTAFEPMLAPGAVVLYDDIHWRLNRRVAAETYAGWREVAGHPRVRRAVEVDRQFGLLLLS